MVSPSISIAPINGRPPVLVFGLNWDMGAPGNPDVVKRLKQRVLTIPGASAAAAKALEDNQREIGLDKVDPELAAVFLGKPEEFIDLDATVIALGKNGEIVMVNGIRDFALEGAMASTGDDRFGAYGGDDEECILQLAMLPPEIETLALLVDSVNGQPLRLAEKALCCLSYSRDVQRIAESALTGAGEHTTLLFGLVRRQGEGFTYLPLNHPFNSTGVESAKAAIGKFL